MRLRRTDGLPIADGITTVTYLGVELTVGYEIFEGDRDTNLPAEFAPMWATLNGVNVSPLIDAIPDGWEEIADEVTANLEDDRDCDY